VILSDVSSLGLYSKLRGITKVQVPLSKGGDESPVYDFHCKEWEFPPRFSGRLPITEVRQNKYRPMFGSTRPVRQGKPVSAHS